MLSLPELTHLHLLYDFSVAKEYVAKRGLEKSATICRLMFEKDKLRLTAFGFVTNSEQKVCGPDKE